MNAPLRHPLCHLCPSALLGLVFLAGCSLPTATPDPTRLFLLPSPTGEHAPTPAPAGRPAVGLRTVAIAAYLRTPALVTLAGSEVRPLGAARWAEPLADGVARVVREELVGQGAVRSVTVYPAPHDATPELEIEIRVVACEGVLPPAGAVRFVADWSVTTTAAEPRVVASGRYAPAPAPWDGRDPAALTQALGTAAAGLAREIAAALPAKP